LGDSTDVHFEYEEIKTGKKVTAINFLLNNSPSKALLPPSNAGENTPVTSDEEQEQLVFELSPIVVKKFGVSLKVFMGLAETHTEGVIRQAIQVTEKAIKVGKVDNIAGFFVEAVRGNYTDAKEQKKQTVIEQKKKTIEESRGEAVIEKKKKDDKQLAYEREMQVFEQIIAGEPTFKQALIDKVRLGIFSSYYKMEMSFEENMKNPLVKATFLNIAKELKPEKF
jgi:hypothetical protein